MSLNSNTESMQELLDEANALPTEEEVYERGFEAGRQTDTTLTKSGVPADAKATGDAIGQVRTDLGKIADYPVEIGTDGVWTWEKWDSGKAVCWGVASLGNVNVNKRWGLSEDGYPWRESSAFTQDFPEGLFIAAPQFLDITVVNSSAAVFVSRYLEDLTATNTGKFTLSRPTSMTVNNVKLGFYAIGRWKQENQVESYVLNNALYVEGPIPESGQIESSIVDNALYVDWRDQE